MVEKRGISDPRYRLILHKNFLTLKSKIQSNPFLCEQLFIYQDLFDKILNDENNVLSRKEAYFDALSEGLSKVKRGRIIKTFEKFDDKIPSKVASTDLEFKIVREVCDLFSELILDSPSSAALMPSKEERAELPPHIVALRSEISKLVSQHQPIERGASVIESSKFLSDRSKFILSRVILNEMTDNEAVIQRRKCFVTDTLRAKRIMDTAPEIRFLP